MADWVGRSGRFEIAPGLSGKHPTVACGEFCRPSLAPVLVQVLAQVGYPSFQGLIKQIPNHQHSSLHPLARPAQLRVIKLGHGSASRSNPIRQMADRCQRKPMAIGDRL
jgi:hypothetical protein